MKRTSNHSEQRLFREEVLSFTREICVCAHLTQTRDAQRACAEMEISMNTIYWAGDSTVQTNDYTTYPQNGIGQIFPIFLKEEYRVENHAKNGRSTKSFMDEGRLAAIDEKIEEGDFLFIQFGHNDEKDEDPSRYTTPFGTFQENLKIYIETARKHGAYPVLITPL